MQTRTGPQERRVGLSQALPWPGTLAARRRVADERTDAAWQRAQAARLEVRRAVTAAYHEYAFLGRELALRAELLYELLRGLEPVVTSRVRTGARQEDLLRLQVELGRLEDELRSLERRRPALSARLAAAAWLELGGGEPLPFPEAPAARGRGARRRARCASARSPTTPTCSR
ncbi:MAG: TolC family protein [Planctomycetes bacterium]|nr:TolC family protein [Planctomycetota bacterium]